MTTHDPCGAWVSGLRQTTSRTLTFHNNIYWFICHPRASSSKPLPLASWTINFHLECNLTRLSRGRTCYLAIVLLCSGATRIATNNSIIGVGGMLCSLKLIREDSTTEYFFLYISNRDTTSKKNFFS